MTHSLPDFIFMLTRDDRTVADAAECLETVLAGGIRHVGFKDIGLPFDDLAGLAATIKAAGGTTYLEVVSLDEASERTSAEAAVRLGVDVLMGGTRPKTVLPVIAGTPIRYYPFPGRIVGHPSRLEGTVASIVESARRVSALEGVSGLDLLAYRFDGEVEELMTEVCSAVDKPVVIAGSINSVARLEAVVRAGASGFTVGTAAFEGAFSQGQGLITELKAIETALKRIAPDIAGPRIDKINLVSAFRNFSDFWSPKVAGEINDMQIKLAKFRGAFQWQHHEHEDELFLVHRGRLLMRFRDSEVHLGAGEFIIVPRMVEHLPVAETEDCEIVLLDPKPTLNTGNIQNKETARHHGRVR